MYRNKNYKNIIIIFILLFSFFPKITNSADQLTDLKKEIEVKQQRAAELDKQIQSYRNAVSSKQAQAITLKKQLSILNDRITAAQLAIKAKELELSTITLQIQSVSLEIARREQELNNKKTIIAEIMQQLWQRDQQSTLEIFVLNPKISQFYEQANYLETLQQNLQNAINEVQILKNDLLHRQTDLSNYRRQLDETKQDLESARSTYSNEQDTKQNLLQQTRQSESKFQALLVQAIQEQQQANRDIKNLEQEIRKRLKQKSGHGLDQLGDAVFMWPVNPGRGISTQFYDPEYIYRKYFEHPGIDIPSPQGNGIKAAADGYVARAKDAGMGYSYIMLIHKGGFATVYGHVSRIDVAEESYVTKGQIIGAIGGLPGTRGAGRLTTGSHLHFEVRSNGIPVNPIDYLP